MDGHADFFAARPERRWTGRLPALRARLAAEAARDPKRRSWKVLRNGACVGLRILDDARVEVRISRRKAPETERARKAWEVELRTFVRDLRLEGWLRVETDAGADGRGVAAIYTEPKRPGPPSVVDLFGEAPAAKTPPSAIEQGR